MRLCALALTIGLFGCSSNSENPSTDSSSGGASMSAGGSATGGKSATGGSGGSGGMGGNTSAGSGGSSNGGTNSAGTSPGGGSAGANTGEGTSASMEHISYDVPAFASAGNPSYHTAADANDRDPMSSWEPAQDGAWLAYDLSGVPAAKRDAVLVVWNALHTGGYVLDNVGVDYEMRPIDYTIETNAAAGGGSAPTDGWTVVDTVTGCERGTVEHAISMTGANWVRINVTKSSNPSGGPSIELDVYSIPQGATDAWLMMGDSITYMSTQYAWSNIPQLVNELVPGRFPQAIDAAIGGTNTGTAMEVIDETMAGFPGRFVVLAYGTNDHANSFQMEGLVQKVIAAGKTPVVPHMPWASGSAEGEAINLQIDALYEKYPEILKGPDLWAGFEGHTEWIPVGDVHPNGDGQGELRKMWAETMAATP